MSGKPSPEGAEAVRFMLRELREQQAKAAELRAAAARLPEVEARCKQLHREIAAKLEAMDVHTAGNYGWEGRTVWFLLELTKPGAL